MPEVGQHSRDPLPKMLVQTIIYQNGGSVSTQFLNISKKGDNLTDFKSGKAPLKSLRYVSNGNESLCLKLYINLEIPQLCLTWTPRLAPA